MKQFAVLILAVLATTAPAQRSANSFAQPPLVGSLAAHPGWPSAQPADVRSIEAIVAALYDVISGPQGRQRDWDRMRSLFLPDARLIPARPDHDTHRMDAVVLTIDNYIERSSPNMTAHGFFERGIHNQVEQFGNIAHVWSTYESRHAAEDPKPFSRGINSIQLLKSNDRYYIVEVLWDSETPASQISTQYLPK